MHYIDLASVGGELINKQTHEWLLHYDNDIQVLARARRATAEENYVHFHHAPRTVAMLQCFPAQQRRRRLARLQLDSPVLLNAFFRAYRAASWSKCTLLVLPHECDNAQRPREVLNLNCGICLVTRLTSFA